MLASSLAPMRGKLSLASAIDPAAAQQAFEKAMTDLDSRTWLASADAVSPAVPQAAVFTPAPKADPAMTDELMTRLIKLTRTIKVGGLDPKLCKVLELCDGSAN